MLRRCLPITAEANDNSSIWTAPTNISIFCPTRRKEICCFSFFFLPKQQLGNFAFDALDEKGRPVLFAWDFDLVRIQSFQLGIRSRDLSGVAVAFDVQAPALQQCLGSEVEVRPLSLARTSRMLLGG